MKTACELLTEMDEEVLVKESDWGQNSYGSVGGPKCLMGALNFCATRISDKPSLTGAQGLEYDVTLYALSKAIMQIAAHSKDEDGRPRLRLMGGCVTLFNDDPDTTFEDVKRALKKAREQVCD